MSHIFKICFVICKQLNEFLKKNRKLFLGVGGGITRPCKRFVGVRDGITRPYKLILELI